MISIGENPEGLVGINKFIARTGDGQRGVVLARTRAKTEAIILSMNESRAGDVKWGRLYKVKERDPEKYPFVVESVDSIPKRFRIEAVQVRMVVAEGVGLCRI